MPKFLIEREMPGAGRLSADELQAIARKACETLAGMGPQIQWIESYVTDDKIYCVYLAPDDTTVHRHAVLGGLPDTRVSQVRCMIDPTTADARAEART